METLTLIEYETVPVVHSRTSGQKAFSHKMAAALRHLETRLPAKAITWGHQSVTFAHFCGVIALGSVSIEILPKIYGREQTPGICRQALVRMLIQARKLPRLKSGTASIALQRHTLLDVFILHFCDQLHNELMQGMIKRYVEKTQNLNVIRGRLKTELQFKYNQAHKERLFCQYDELNTDNIYNRIIKYTLKSMQSLTTGHAASRKLNELLMRFDHIKDIRVNIRMFDVLAFDRSIRRYKNIFRQCRWIIEGLHPDVVAGSSSCLSILFDMNRLFEAYVAVQMRKIAWSTGRQMREQGPQRHMVYRKDRDENLFVMKPDMVFLNEKDVPIAIADAKWKLLDEKEKKMGISQGDLYQMSAYATRYGVASLALVYPLQSRLTRSVKLQLQGKETTITIFPMEITMSGDVDYWVSGSVPVMVWLTIFRMAYFEPTILLIVRPFL